MSAYRRSSGRHPIVLPDIDDPVVELAQALRDLIDGLGLTRQQVCQRIYIAESTLSKALGGRYVPTWPTTWNLARLDSNADEAHWNRLWVAARSTKVRGGDTEPIRARPEPGYALLSQATIDAVVEMSGLPDWRPLRTPVERVIPPRPPDRRTRVARLVIALIVAACAGGLLAPIALNAGPTVTATVTAYGARLHRSPSKDPRTVVGEQLQPGARIGVECGQSGDLVTSTDQRQSTTWLRQADGSFLSATVIDVTGPPLIANCVTGQAPLPVHPGRAS